MCNYTDAVWIGQPDVNEQLVSRRTSGSTVLAQWYERATHHGVDVLSVRHITGSAYERATHHGVGVLSVRHITGSPFERATHHGVGVLSVRHITGSPFERATHHGVGVRETSKRSRTTARA